MGGLGLRSAARSAPGAFWASWVATLPVIRAKQPGVAAAIFTDITGVHGPTTTTILLRLQACARRLQQEGFQTIPGWRDIFAGVDPAPLIRDADAADFVQGWQCIACSFSEQFFIEHEVHPECDGARKALLLSQSGGPAGAFLRAIPSEPIFTMSAFRLQVAIRRRLRWILPLSGSDILGDRAAADSRSGKLKLRSVPLERVWKRILREAGARVRENVALVDTAVPNIYPGDRRRIEIVASGLPVAQGVPIAVDVTMVSPLHADGTPFPKAANLPGKSFARAIRKKSKTYPELLNNPHLKLVVAAMETGGRVHTEALRLLDQAAAAKARQSPTPLQPHMARVWRARWVSMLSVVAQDALAATLVDDGTIHLDAADGAVLTAEAWQNGEM